MRMFLLCLSAIAIAACGDSGSNNNDGADSGSSEPTRTGFTSCGPEQCQPGQYCLNATGGFCEAGCLSDLNCASNQECVKESGDAAGTCQNITTTPREDVTNPPADTSTPDTSTPDTSTPRPETCEAVCNKGFECGLFSAQMAAGCKQVCEEVPEGFDLVADCVHLAQCGPSLPSCYDMECGGSYGCPAGETCDEDFGTCE